MTTSPPLAGKTPNHEEIPARIMLLWLCAYSFLLFPALISISAHAEYDGSDQQPTKPLTQLSLEELGNVRVTTVSKEPEQLWKTAAAVFVLANEDIRRSGATSVAEALRLVPGVEVRRIYSNQWAIGIRGSETNFSKGVLVLIDGQSVYTPLWRAALCTPSASTLARLPVRSCKT